MLAATGQDTIREAPSGDLHAVVIRLAKPFDVDVVFELAVKMREETHWKHVAFTPDREKVVLWLLWTLSTSLNHVLYVAESDRHVVGFCLGMVTSNPWVPDVLFVCELGWYVEPLYRATHVGMALWRQVVQWGKQRGAQAAWYSKPILTHATGKVHPIELTMWRELRTPCLLE